MARARRRKPSYSSIPQHVADEIRATLKRYPAEGVEKLLAELNVSISSFAIRGTRESKAQIRKDLKTVAELASRLDKAIHRMSEQGRWALQGAYAAFEHEGASLFSTPNYQTSAIQDLAVVAVKAHENYRDASLSPKLDWLCFHVARNWLRAFNIHRTPNIVRNGSPMVRVVDALHDHLKTPGRTIKPTPAGNDVEFASSASRLNQVLKDLLQPKPLDEILKALPQP
jgi:hypothetical protein